MSNSSITIWNRFVILFSLINVCILSGSFAQQLHDQNWVFRTYYGDAMILNFGRDSLRLSIQDANTGIKSSNTSMSDENGNLLFYSNGCKIFNSKHQVIKDGDKLNSGSLRNDECSNRGGYNAGHQTMISIPNPGNPNQYYIFHVSTVWIYEPTLDIRTKYLYYTVVDFSHPDGFVPRSLKPDTNNNVYLKNVPLLEDTSIQTGEMTAIKHANNRYWWVFNTKYSSNTYIRLLVTDKGVLGPYYQIIGDSFNANGVLNGNTCFSPNGKKFVRYNTLDGLYVYDFDRETGLLSNFKNVVLNEPVGVGGVAVSSNSRFVYASSYKKLFQFDLEASDFEASKVLIDTFNWVGSPFPPLFNFFCMTQLGPDCRIYITSYNSSDRLSVIKYPDLPGKACNFVQQGLALPSTHGGSLPHFPNYRLGTGLMCDSSIKFITKIELPINSVFTKLYPNPFHDQIQLEIELVNQTNVHFVLYDMNLVEVFKENLNSSQTNYVFNLPNLPSGLFTYFIYSNEGVLDKGRLVKFE